jgi:hypothetical protein
MVDTLRSGDLEAGARLFVETVALGPGMWEKLPPEMRRTFVFNASTWWDEMNEPERVTAVDVEGLSAFNRPVLITKGDQSPPRPGLSLARTDV